MSSLSGNTEERIVKEAVRASGMRDLQNGMKQADVARKYSISRTSAHRWARRLSEGRSATRTISTGRPSRLTSEQLRELKGMELSGLSGIEIRDLIEKRFGIRYHRDHAMRLRHKVQSNNPRARPVP